MLVPNTTKLGLENFVRWKTMSSWTSAQPVTSGDTLMAQQYQTLVLGRRTV